MSLAPSPAALARLRRCRGFLIDMDGTIYIDDVLVPGAHELLAHLDGYGLRYVFVTNNSSARARDYHARLARLGIHVAPEQVGHLWPVRPRRYSRGETSSPSS